MQQRAFSFVELLVVTAIVAAISTMLFPVAAQRRKSKITNKPNLEKISVAAIAYGADYDDHIPISINGPMRSLQNTGDDKLTRFGEKRTDYWPLLLLPFVKDRSLFQDPRRDDIHHIWSAPAHSTFDPGYDPYGASYRNQSRYPSFGLNYLFLSPIEVTNAEEDPGQGITMAESHSFAEATDPKSTIFFVTSKRGMVPTTGTDRVGVPDNVRGFFVVDAPGMFNALADPSSLKIVFTTGTACSGDWCGDVDSHTMGKQKGTNFAYIEKVLGGNNVAFLDGHVKFMTDPQMAAGTDYLDAVPNGQDDSGGAIITDKRKYLWDLNGNFYGADKGADSTRSGR